MSVSVVQNVGDSKKRLLRILEGQQAIGPSRVSAD